MLRQITSSPWFALGDVLLVLTSSAALAFIPSIGPWVTLLAFLPWGARLLAGDLPFRRTPFDWLILVFLITAWVGYLASYDKTSAWNKVWFIVLAVLLYYALSAQPEKNHTSLSILSFSAGLAISIYFFLTHDFSGAPEKIALWWMSNRPQTGWSAIHHGYISGLLVITGLFAVYWLRGISGSIFNRYSHPTKILLILGVGMIIGAFLLTMSRGMLAAAACGLGIWMVWWLITSSRFAEKLGMRSLFPVLVLVCICIVIAYVYLGPENSGRIPTQSNYGTNSRGELFVRGAYFLADYPITGGGLNSFPGLYSQYMLVIPFYYFMNSYNIFLDIGIEQGLIGGLSFLGIYLGSIWLVARAIVKQQPGQMLFFNWLSLFALIVTVVHGFFYNYLYNGIGTLLLFYPVGISAIGITNFHGSQDRIWASAGILPALQKRKILVFSLSLLLIVVISAVNVNNLVSIWYSNIGAIQMAQAELENFPANKWATADILPELEQARFSLQSALRYDPNNATANYRLGMIFMLSQDFESALVNLEAAHKTIPNHRGVTKSLAYCYTWLGEMDNAQLLLESIPESQSELEVYEWWWGTQGRQDLSANAYQLVSLLNKDNSQP